LAVFGYRQKYWTFADKREECVHYCSILILTEEARFASSVPEREREGEREREREKRGERAR
jgi:hypothetical protein